MRRFGRARPNALKRRYLLAGLAVFPAAGLAQQARPNRRVGILMSTADSDSEESQSIAAFLAALDKLGWQSGRNVEIVARWGASDAERMRANAREMAALAPDVIIVKGASVPAVHEATSTIPTVFVAMSDAAAQDYVGSFSRPTGNITGFASFEFSLVGKRLELLRDLSPGVRSVLYIRSLKLGTATRALFERISRDTAMAGLALTDCAAESDADIEKSVAAFAGGSDRGIVVAFDAFTTVHRAIIIGLAERHRMPAIYPLPAFVHSGGLCSYGFNQDEQFRQAAGYVDRLLRGETPSELAVQEPTKFQLVINVGTAKALGLTPPAVILARADEVIE